MFEPVCPLVFQTATPVPGTGPEELADYWLIFERAGWFLAGFVAVLLIGWFAVEPAISRIIRRRNRNNPTIQEAISRYIRLLILLVGVFIGAGVAGYGRFLSNSALIIAAGTLAIGVAGQAVIGSLVSGLVLVIDPEFNIGNYIEWEGGQGTVESITLRVTRVQTLDGKLITVPNTLLTSQAVTRPFGRGRYRIVEHVGLAYEDDIEEALALLRTAATELDAVRSDPAPAAYVDDFGSDAVIVRIHFWIDSPQEPDIFEVRSAYARSVKARLDEAGITISPPSKRDLRGRIAVEKGPWEPDE